MNETRETLAKLFLPESQESLEKLSLDELNEITKKLLGCEHIQKYPCLYRGEYTDSECIYSKYLEFFGLYRKYTNLFEFSKYWGVRHIYDIGCASVNQSFMLLDDSDIAYTGIDSAGFALMDYRKNKDETYPNYHYPFSEQVPGLCEGRIKFINDTYPFDLQPEENSIALAIHSIGTYKIGLGTGPEIKDIAMALNRDFDRIVMDIGWKEYNNRYEFLPMWQEFMPGFRFIRFDTEDTSTLMFITKHDEDLDKLKELSYVRTETSGNIIIDMNDHAPWLGKNFTIG